MTGATMIKRSVGDPVRREDPDWGMSAAGEDFRAFFNHHYPAMKAHVVLSGYDRGNVEEALLDAFVQAARHWPLVRTYDYPRAWLYQVFRRRLGRISGWWAKRTLLPLPASAAAEPEAARFEAVRAAVNRLPAGERDVVHRFYWLHQSVQEIADERGTAVGTVKSQLSKARVRLAQYLGLPPDPAGLDDQVGLAGRAHDRRLRNLLDRAESTLVAACVADRHATDRAYRALLASAGVAGAAGR